MWSTFRNYTHSEPKFRVLLTEGRSEVLFNRDAYEQGKEAVV